MDFFNKKIFFESLSILVLIYISSFFIYIIGYSLYENLKIFIGNLAIISIILLILISYLTYDSIKKERKRKSLFDLIVFMFPIGYIYLLYASFEKLIYYNNFDISSIILPFLISIHFIIIYLAKLFNKININQKNLINIFLILLIFLIGLILIINFTEEEKHSFKLFLNECNTSKHFKNSQIECNSLLNKVLVGNKVNCKINNINLDIINGSFKFELLNGSLINQKFNKTPFFIVPNNVGRTNLKLLGKYNNKSICLSTGISQTFASYNQYKENKKNFASYLLALIAFILITYPSILKKWNNFF